VDTFLPKPATQSESNLVPSNRVWREELLCRSLPVRRIGSCKHGTLTHTAGISDNHLIASNPHAYARRACVIHPIARLGV